MYTYFFSFRSETYSYRLFLLPWNFSTRLSNEIETRFSDLYIYEKKEIDSIL